MTEKWTPGPWHIERDDTPGMEWNNHICSSTGRICFMAHESPDWTNDGLEAAAHLIASAPALYEALNNIVAWKEAIEILSPELGGALKAIYAGEAALRAARGEQS